MGFLVALSFQGELLISVQTGIVIKNELYEYASWGMKLTWGEKGYSCHVLVGVWSYISW